MMDAMDRPAWTRVRTDYLRGKARPDVTVAGQSRARTFQAVRRLAGYVARTVGYAVLVGAAIVAVERLEDSGRPDPAGTAGGTNLEETRCVP